MKNLIIFLAGLGMSLSAFASGSLSIETAQNQSINLADQVNQIVTLVSDGSTSGEVKLSIDSTELHENFDKAGEVSIEIEPTTIIFNQTDTRAQFFLRTVTQSSAPSFSGGKFTIHADSGNVHGSSDIVLSVKPLYIVNILNGMGEYKFAFNSPEKELKFRPHAQGLVVRFLNLSNEDVVIHGTGAIPHGDISDPMKAAVGIYEIPPIMPRDGSDLPGYYTIHNIYKPERHVMFNDSGKQVP